MRRHYKVVALVDGRLVSVAAPTPVVVEYRPGEWVTAPIGGLLVFASHAEAERYVECLAPGRPLVEIWTVESRGPVPLPQMGLWCPKRWAVQIDEVMACWRGDTSLAFTLEWPDGTQAFRKVRLIEPVWPARPRARTRRQALQEPQ